MTMVSRNLRESSTNDEAWTGPRWEYRTLQVGTKGGDDRLTDDLNRLGAEGWEAVTYGVPVAGPHRIVLKRPV